MKKLNEIPAPLYEIEEEIVQYLNNIFEQQEKNRGIWKGGHHDSSDSGNRGNHSPEHLSIN